MTRNDSRAREDSSDRDRRAARERIAGRTPWSGPYRREAVARLAPGTFSAIPDVRLRDETILLISPQSWEHIAISKHHYARELARRGNRVFYLDPPVPDLAAPVTIEAISDTPGLSVVRYRPMIPLDLRFHARRVYNALLRLQTRRIRRAIAQPITVTWCFDTTLFTDLRLFGASLNIYHPVDTVHDPRQILPAKTADAVLAVSEPFVRAFSGVATPAWFVNHGLAEEFASEARRMRDVAPRQEASGGTVRIGYAGNLVNPAVGRDVLRVMIAAHPEVEFHFWGPYEILPYMLPVAPEIPAFIDFLRRAPNVRLHGPTPSAVLAREMQAMDVFLLAYSPAGPAYDCSNSHKILEYLSTGKVTVSSRISTYADRRDLLVMPQDGDDAKLPELLDRVLERLDELNSPERQALRRAFALENTYSCHIDRIAALVSQLPTREAVQTG